MTLRVLVVTVVHDPRDARIAQRQIRALLAAGDEVTFAAPFTGYDAAPPEGVTPVDLPRSMGRHRLRAARAARHTIDLLGPTHDVVLVHDPELLVATAGVRHPLIVWDVHEDTGAALTMKDWLPSALRPVAGRAVGAAEWAAERGHRLILAEDGYTQRFRESHPVVPNSTPVPLEVAPPSQRRAVYVGRVSPERGGFDLVETGRLLAASGVALDVIGPADSRVTGALDAAREAGWLRWEGFLPNDVALARVEGAVAGLSLLHDEPNYRHSMPTKVAEYMARGVPVVTTPLPRAVQLVEAAGAGVVVPFNDARAAASAVVTLADSLDVAAQWGAAGHAYALEHLNWDVDGPRFVAQLHSWAQQSV